MIKKDRILSGLFFDNFLEEAENKVTSIGNENNESSSRALLEYTKLNVQRMKRIIKSYSPSVEIKDVVAQISEKQIWMVITEDWCGDSAQNLPYIYLISKLNSNIVLRIIERDVNLDIMDLYLTNGGRSIPKLVAFDDNMNELFQWGARPQEAQDMFMKMKSEGIEKDKLVEQLHLWYGRNRGKALESEFVDLLKIKAAQK